jgi:hypothetical protein
MSDRPDPWIWSSAREACFRRCPRQYFFAYHSAPAGGAAPGDPRLRTFHVLGRLISRRQWLDATVRNCLRWVLGQLRQSGAAPDEAVALGHLVRRLQADFLSSGEGLYWEEPTKYPGLLEHEYDERDVAEAEWQELFQAAALCVSNFFQGPVIRELRALNPADWLEIEARPCLRLGDLAAEIPLDCAHRAGDQVMAYRWETGAGDPPPPDPLALLALYAARRWSLPADRIIAREYNLARGAVREQRPAEEDLRQIQTRIESGAAALRPAPNPTENQFPLTGQESACPSCNFTRVCPKFINRQERAEPRPDGG